jgi:hypothetical protein
MVELLEFIIAFIGVDCNDSNCCWNNVGLDGKPLETVSRFYRLNRKDNQMKVANLLLVVAVLLFGISGAATNRLWV